VPKLWSETIESHRRDVRDAVMETTAALVAEHGLRAVTMSQIAEGAGIGRATLYKYFPDVDSILVAWHDRHVTAHLQGLVELGHGAGDPRERLAAVLESYALMSHEVASAHHGTDLVALIHSPQHITHAQHQLDQLVRDLIAEAARLGMVRDDVAPDELATYCLSALSAAPGQTSKAAVRRLVRVTLTGLRRGGPG
jgi:AcrR family transcriptional regulator